MSGGSKAKFALMEGFQYTSSAAQGCMILIHAKSLAKHNKTKQLLFRRGRQCPVNGDCASHFAHF